MNIRPYMVVGTVLFAVFAHAADRWQPLTDGFEFDTDTFKAGTTDGKAGNKEPVVSGWIRFTVTDTQYLIEVQGLCESRVLKHIRSVALKKKDGSETRSDIVGTFPVTPGSDFEGVLLALCKRVKPWWKPF